MSLLDSIGGSGRQWSAEQLLQPLSLSLRRSVTSIISHCLFPLLSHPHRLSVHLLLRLPLPTPLSSISIQPPRLFPHSLRSNWIPTSKHRALALQEQGGGRNCISVWLQLIPLIRCGCFFFTPSTNSWTGLAGVRADTVTVSVIVSGVRHRVVITDDSNKKEKKPLFWV